MSAMEHVVFYQSSQGTPAFRRLSSLEEAVSFAEHLRNVEGVTDFSVYALSPVTLSLRAYYHVEVSGDGDPSSAPAAPPALTEPSAPTAEADEAPAPAPAAAAAPTADDDLAAAPTGSGEPPFIASTPFGAGPSMSATQDPQQQDAPGQPAGDSLEPGAPLPDSAAQHAVIDPSVVDPTVEEVVPMGRRSMGFFARS
jgi:hypothetical protein